jgi:hypothetical protein
MSPYTTTRAFFISGENEMYVSIDFYKTLSKEEVDDYMEASRIGFVERYDRFFENFELIFAGILHLTDVSAGLEAKYMKVYLNFEKPIPYFFFASKFYAHLLFECNFNISNPNHKTLVFDINDFIGKPKVILN